MVVVVVAFVALGMLFLKERKCEGGGDDSLDLLGNTTLEWPGSKE